MAAVLGLNFSQLRALATQSEAHFRLVSTLVMNIKVNLSLQCNDIPQRRACGQRLPSPSKYRESNIKY